MKRIGTLAPAVLVLAGTLWASQAQAQQPNKREQAHQQPQSRPAQPAQRPAQHARAAQPQPRRPPARPPQPSPRAQPSRRVAPPPRRVAAPPPRVAPPPRRVAAPPRRVAPPPRRIAPRPRRVAPPPRRVAPPGRVVAPPSPQRHALEARQRDAQSRVRIGREIGEVQARGALLEREHRRSQYALEQRYEAQLRQQQERLRVEPNYESAFLAPPVYYYPLNGEYYEANQFVANRLRQAVGLGYQEGFQAGQADRSDGYRFDFGDNYIYQDANYGYEGYVSVPDYSHYYREGFQRGYEDGYYGRYRYGAMFNGQPSILGSVLTSILGLMPIR